MQPIHPERPLHKVLSRGGSFGESTADPVVLYAWLVRNLERLIEELEYHGVPRGPADGLGRLQERPVPASARRRCRSPATGSTSCSTRPAPASAGRGCPRVPATPHAPDRRAADRPRPVPAGPVRPARAASRAEAVARLKREVNARHGRFVLRSAATLPLAAIYRDTANEYDICDVRGKICF